MSILDLDLSPAQLALQRRRLTVSGFEATLSADGAAALNQAFALQLPAGLAIGTASVDLALDRGHDTDSDSDR